MTADSLCVSIFFIFVSIFNVMPEYPIKSSAANYSKAPFYLIQKNQDSKRYVVYLNDKVRIRILLAGFINQQKESIQVKVVDFKNREETHEYLGLVQTKKLHELMTSYEQAIFHHGKHDLMFRNQDTGDVIAFDEHGLIFIYTDQNYETTLEDLEAAYKPKEKLIYELDHWHHSEAGSYEKLLAFIHEMNLEQIY